MLEDPGPRGRPASGRRDDISRRQGSPSAAPDILIRTMEGYITSWSPGMERRYGFACTDVLGQTSHELLRTAFPRALPEIGAMLVSQHTWSSWLIHHHADGRPIMAVNHWFLSCDCANQDWRVTEVHCDVAPGSKDACDRLADLLEALAHELSEPLTAIGNYIDGAHRILQPGWPDLENLRKAMTLVKKPIARGAEGVRLLRALAVSMRDTE